MSRAPLRVAVLGAGTVGREVIRAFSAAPERLASTDGAPLALVAVAVRDLGRPRELAVDSERITDAPAHLVASPEVDVVVELMGGEEPARTLVTAALAAGKPVVTANKHLVAHHGPELETLARRVGTPFRFEAAVGGGIPVLRPIAEDLAADRIDGVRGIVNGTTNFILTAMADERRPYADILAAAQAQGYAEADPSGDVEGGDAINKLVILARLAFGAWLDPDSVERHPPTVAGTGRPGITGVTADEIAAAAVHGLTLKLIASAERRPDGTIAAAVVPTAVPSGGPLARTSGVLNRIEVTGEPIGTVAFSGPGAGGGATSSAVLADLMAVARHDASTWAGLSPAVGAALVAGRLDETPVRRFFASTLPEQLVRDQLEIDAAKGGGFITAARPLDELRAGLAAAGVDATLYPLDDR